MVNRCVVEWLKDLRYDVDDEFGVCWGVMDDGGGENAGFELKFGKVCRVSVNFGETLERLPTLPVVYENLGLDVSADVTMWKERLRHSCCGEEENLFEGEDLIDRFGDDSKNVEESCSKPGSFPPCDHEEEVQIRTGRSSVRARPQTFASPPIKKKEDPHEFRGPFRIKTDKETDVTKLERTDTLKITADQLQIFDENRKIRETHRVALKKGTKTITKEEVEMVDAERRIYRFVFDSEASARLFVEWEKSRPSTGKGTFAQLLKLLKKRSSRDLLESKGIIKNEPIFGNTLKELCKPPNSVPEVITTIVRLIEDKHENITSLGLYRASANLATVQQIRCEINCGRWGVLDKYKQDVDVLAGTLKLFFRELKEPIIPFETYQRLVAIIRGSPTTDGSIGTIINSLPEPNRATLLYIIKHLLKVCSYKNENKMDVHNMAICWGPSLIMFPDNCVDLVTQTTEFTTIVEHILCYYQQDTDETADTPPPKTNFVYEAVRKLTETIESHLDVEGIYRKSGSNKKIDEIMRQLDRKCLVDFDSAKMDIHDLCCALKKFLGSLKEPLVPNEIFDYYCEICDKLESTADEIVRRIHLIPQKDALLRLLQHLRKVIEHEKNNKMSINVMSDIWMTTLTKQYKKKIPKSSKLFEILIDVDERVLPDLLPESESLQRIRESQYDNVPDDINDKTDCVSDNADTKL